MARPRGFINYAGDDCINGLDMVFGLYVGVDFVAYIVQIFSIDLRDQSTDLIFRNWFHPAGWLSAEVELRWTEGEREREAK